MGEYKITDQQILEARTRLNQNSDYTQVLIKEYKDKKLSYRDFVIKMTDLAENPTELFLMAQTILMVQVSPSTMMAIMYDMSKLTK